MEDLMKIITNLSQTLNATNNDIHKGFRDVNSRLDKIELAADELRNEFNAKIDAKIDKVRCDIIDMRSEMDTKLTTFTDQMDAKITQIYDKINENKKHQNQHGCSVWGRIR